MIRTTLSLLLCLTPGLLVAQQDADTEELRERIRERLEAVRNTEDNRAEDERGSGSSADQESVDMNQLMAEFFKDHEVELGNVTAALECAALADRFDSDESMRLRGFGTSRGIPLYVEMSSLMLQTGAPEAPDDSDVEKMLVENTGFTSLRELAAFQLGSMYGKLEERFFRDIPFGGSGEAWTANYRSEYNKKNCRLIGRNSG